MARKKKKNLVFRVRYRDSLGIKSRLVVGRGTKRPKGCGKGKVLRVNKVSEHELYHMGEYNDMPNRLMQEFKRNGNGAKPAASKDLVEVS